MSCFNSHPDRVLRRLALAFTFSALMSFVLLNGAAAAPVYLAPADTSSSPPPADGSRAAPFRDLAQAVAAVSAAQGDYVALLAGHYGSVVWAGIAPTQTVVIRAEHPGQVHFDSLDLNNLHNLHFLDFAVWPRVDFVPNRPLVRTDSRTSQITIEGFDIRGREDAADYMTWSLDDWSIWQATGIQIQGTDVTAQNNQLTAVGGGISSSRAGAVVVGNTISGFSGDGLRGIGNDSLFQGNRVQDCVVVDANHDDGFQSWSPRGQGAHSEVVNISIIENIIVEWTGARDHPLRCSLQGIGLFDGFYRNFEIVNNLIVVSAYHGIALYGGIDSRIVHNTVVHGDHFTTDRPWIAKRPHKNGTPSQNVTVENNVAMTITGFANALANNVAVASATAIFQDPATGDFTPRADSPLVDSALPLTSGTAPTRDVFGTSRPQGAGSDFGAIELIQ